MLIKNKTWINLAIVFTIQALPVMAFDLEDYATTYRATRDAYLKAANELKLATGPYKSARDSYSAAVKKYVSGLNDGSPAVAKAKLTSKSLQCGLIYQDYSYTVAGNTAKTDNNGNPYLDQDGKQVVDADGNPLYLWTDLGKGPTMFWNEDYITTERATRAAYEKAAKELIKSAYELKSAEDAYKQASYTYIKSTEIHDRYILQKQINMQQK